MNFVSLILFPNMKPHQKEFVILCEDLLFNHNKLLFPVFAQMRPDRLP
jgi:hypothetical protein